MAGIVARDFCRVSLAVAGQDCSNNSLQTERAGWRNETNLADNRNLFLSRP